MSTNKILRGSLIAAFGIAGLATTADAQSRYGNVYDYESGKCGSACAAPAPMQSYSSQSSRYGNSVMTQPAYAAPQMQVAPGPVYVDCRATGTCAPQPQTVYSQPSSYVAPAPTYQAQSYQTQSYQAPAQQLPAECPAGTTPQSDGTCMESSYSSSTSSYSAPTSSYSSSGYSASASAPANCPAGTTAQSDGTCMEGGSSSYSNAYSGSSVELYTGDAATTPSYGYSSDGSYGATDYLPIRK